MHRALFSHVLIVISRLVPEILVQVLSYFNVSGV